jgi:hypothetical protein
MSSILTNVLDVDQRRAVENIRAAAERIWSRPLHRYYTDHTVAHSERVIALLDGLTAGMMATEKRLSPSEVFTLLAAAYLHDIGMQNEKFAGGDPSASSGQRLEQIRAHHNEQTAEMIYAVFEDPENAFHIPLARDPGIIEAVALVAKGHRQVNLASAEYDTLVHGGETLRLRLLAALLRFGDELDIDHRRVDLEQMKLLALPAESQLHWWKCHYVSGVSIEDEYIRVSYRFPKDRSDFEDLIVPLVEEEIRTKHTALEPIFRANAVKVALGQPQVRSMRLVQPLPSEVEALAREQITGEPGASVIPEMWWSGRGERREERDEREKKREADASRTNASTTIFDQRGQTVGTQINVAGDYVDQRSGADLPQAPPAPTTAEPSGSWNTEAVRELLSAAFSDGELTTLCFDHFCAVYEGFSAGMGKGDKIQRLLDYCIRHEQMEALLALVRERNLAQYTRFEEQLTR